MPPIRLSLATRFWASSRWILSTPYRMNTKAANYDKASIKERKYIHTWKSLPCMYMCIYTHTQTYTVYIHAHTDNRETKLWGMATVAANPTSFPKFSPGAVCCGRTSPAWGISAGPTVSAGRPLTVAWARLPKSELNQQIGILNHSKCFKDLFDVLIFVVLWIFGTAEELTLRSAGLLFLLPLRDALGQVLFLPAAEQTQVNVRSRD